MKAIQTIKEGKNFKAANFGRIDEMIEHDLPMGPDFTLHGKVFGGQATRNSISFCVVRVSIRWMARFSL